MKNYYNKLIYILACYLMLSTHQILADENNTQPLLGLSVGKVGVFDSEPKSTRYGIEYRGTPLTKWKLTPSFGTAWSVNNNQYYYTEFKRDWLLKHNFIFTASFGMGLFNNTRDIDLGSTLEFRSGIEMTYQFKSGQRLGLASYHLSNSKISNINPGTESLIITYLHPLKMHH